MTRDEPAGGTTHLRVLLVDDDPACREVVGRALRSRGYDVVAVADSDEALAWTALETPALAILDVDLPGVNGFALCEVLRARARTRNIPIIFLTALKEPQHMRQGERAGSDVYLTKPVPASRLLNMVALFLSPEGSLKRKHGPRL